jgi:glycosyltransferase involved in cell wall biosynthesis
MLIQPFSELDATRRSACGCRPWFAGRHDPRTHRPASRTSAAQPPGRTVTSTGRFRADKAPDVLVEALALLDAPPPAYLVGDGPLRPALAQLVRDRGLQTVVRLPGWCDKPSRYVAGASVHVVPSREESWSQSAVLALGLGVPVVGTAVDGLAQTLGDGRGILVPPDHPHALAAALSRVLAGERPDPGPGRAYAWQFTPAAAAAVYLDTYRHLLASRTNPPVRRRSGCPQPSRRAI